MGRRLPDPFVHGWDLGAEICIFFVLFQARQQPYWSARKEIFNRGKVSFIGNRFDYKTRSRDPELSGHFLRCFVQPKCLCDCHLCFLVVDRSGSAVSLKTMIASRTLQNGRPLQNLRTQERRGSLPNAENENLTKKEPKMRRISVPEVWISVISAHN